MSLAVLYLNDPSRRDATAEPVGMLEHLDTLIVRRETRPGVMAELQQKPAAEMETRFSEGHRAYVAWRSGEAAAWGWVATQTARIGELAVTFVIPDRHRYLWNFVTLPAHRGLGIYPRLLQAIIQEEQPTAEAFWIAYAPENHASGSGIRKAGFADVAEMSFDPDGNPAVTDIRQGGARVAAEFLGLPVSDELTPCWRCGKRAATGAESCHAGPCECDYQRPISGCTTPAAVKDREAAVATR